MKQEERTAKRVELVRKARPTEEGAGVRLMRAFGEVSPLLDPFLMLDDFSSDDPRDYMAGFPRHPHRGMETVTYMLSGHIDHEDSMGNRGTVGPGEVQWMTAGSGIIHGEMPRPTQGPLQGLQLWINLPRESKMMAPRYRGIRAEEVPVVAPSEGIEVKVIAGQFGGNEGPVRDLMVEVEYLDVSMGPSTVFRHATPPGFNTFAYVLDGKATFGSSAGTAERQTLVILGEGDEVVVRAGKAGARFLLVSGRPLREPVAWQGPVVMSSEEELEEAFREIQAGTFVRERPQQVSGP